MTASKYYFLNVGKLKRRIASILDTLESWAWDPNIEVLSLDQCNDGQYYFFTK
jgi:hypothetical protein